jgi:hypothetical protein
MIKMDFKKVVWDSVYWFYTALDENQWNGNEPSAFIKFGEFYDQLSDCHLLKKDYVP